MYYIIGGSAKGDDLVSATIRVAYYRGTLTEKDFVPTTHVEDKGKLPITCTPSILDHVLDVLDVDPETLDISDIPNSQHVWNVWSKILFCRSSLCVYDYKEIECQRHTLTNIIFLANVINNLTKGVAKIKQHEV